MAPHAHIGRAGISPCPSSWYLIERSSNLAPGQVHHATIGTHDLVVFRGREDGQVRALAAHCPHMGCHLKGGRVIRNHIRCPLHFRLFDGSGRCRTAGNENSSRRGPAQPTYPALERFGAIFVFLGTGPVFEFPAPHQEPPSSFVTLPTASFEFALPWYALVANGCDLDHLQTVHRRRLKEPAEVGEISPAIFHVRYRAEVIGNGLADRLMRRISGNDVRVTISCFGGSLLLVESRLGERRSFLMMSMRPTCHGTSIQGIVGLPRRGYALIDAVSVRIAAWLFLAFLKRDFAILDGLQLHRPHPPLTDGDRSMSRLFDYFHDLDRPTVDPAPCQAADR